MTDPISASVIGAVGLGANIFGGLTSASGAVKTGQAQLQQNMYQYGTALLNAQIAQQNEEYALNTGEQKSQQAGMAGGQRLASIETAQAASGIEVNTGSAKDVQEGQKKIINMDVDQIRSDAAKTAYNFDVESVQYTRQGQLYLMAGSNAVQAAGVNAESSILGAAGSVASKWMQGSQSGMFGNIGSGLSGLASDAGEAIGFNPFGDM